MKKKICAMLLGLMIAGSAMSMGVSAASQGAITISYTIPQSNAVVIDKGGNQVQTGDTSSSAWIYTLAGAASLLAMVWILLSKRRKEEEDDGKEIVES